MRAIEFIKEQGMIGTVGSTTGSPQQVSQTPQAKPAAPGTSVQNTGTNTTLGQQTPDPKLQQLAGTLKQNNIIGNEKELSNFIAAYQAQNTGKVLNPQQQTAMVKLAGALMKNRNLSTNLDTQIKSISQQKPGQ